MCPERDANNYLVPKLGLIINETLHPLKHRTAAEIMLQYSRGFNERKIQRTNVLV